jgi:hypothetical protein
MTKIIRTPSRAAGGITKAVEALKPIFARSPFSDILFGEAADDAQMTFTVRMDVLRAAQSAYAALTALQEQPAPTKPVAFRYRYEPGLQWHVAQFEDQLPNRGSFPHSQVEPLYPDLQPSPAREEGRDYGKMMQPPADATHCGGYPVNPASEEAPKYVVFDWEYRKGTDWGYARTPDEAKRKHEAGYKITPVYVPFNSDYVCGLPTVQPSPAREEAEDEAYQIGLNEGYEKAVQDIDILTGGDGEYVYSTLPGEGCPGPHEMKARLAERFEAKVVAREEAEALEIPSAKLIAAHLWFEDIVGGMEQATKIGEAVHAFIAREILGREVMTEEVHPELRALERPDFRPDEPLMTENAAERLLWSAGAHGEAEARATAAEADAAAARKRVRELEERLRDILLSLNAATSLLSRSPKTAAPSDKMFDKMLADYEASAERAHTALTRAET